MGAEELRKLRTAFEERFERIRRTSERLRIAPPDKEALWAKVLGRYREGFRCAYCGAELMVKDPQPPHFRSFSIDHKVSLHLGGNNSLGNLEVVCHRCNIVKGTMREETYRRLLSFCPPDLIDRMYGEMWAGRIADKLEREEKLWKRAP